MVGALACGGIGAAAGALLGDPYLLAASAFLAACMGAIAVVDARHYRVPDPWNIAAAIGGLIVAWLSARPIFSEQTAALGASLLHAALCGGAFWLLREAYYRWRDAEGLGLGDVKLAATAGIWLGWQLFASAVVVAAAAALLWIGARALAGRAWPRDRKIPLGAFLAPAIWMCWYGLQIMPSRWVP